MPILQPSKQSIFCFTQLNDVGKKTLSSSSTQWEDRNAGFGVIMSKLATHHCRQNASVQKKQRNAFMEVKKKTLHAIGIPFEFATSNLFSLAKRQISIFIRINIFLLMKHFRRWNNAYSLGETSVNSDHANEI